MTLFTDTEEKFPRAVELAEQSFEIGEQAVSRKLILNRIS
jgi:hypothetical protein